MFQTPKYHLRVPPPPLRRHSHVPTPTSPGSHERHAPRPTPLAAPPPPAVQHLIFLLHPHLFLLRLTIFSRTVSEFRVLVGWLAHLRGAENKIPRAFDGGISAVVWLGGRTPSQGTPPREPCLYPSAPGIAQALPKGVCAGWLAGWLLPAADPKIPSLSLLHPSPFPSFSLPPPSRALSNTAAPRQGKEEGRRAQAIPSPANDSITTAAAALAVVPLKQVKPSQREELGDTCDLYVENHPHLLNPTRKCDAEMEEPPWAMHIKRLTR
ncbi:hypothetical protein O3P69_020839 [Scylla paramamosain]|uniref:Uncharacterized protein n=1 Tax=Scylla paramamosain TaxID=85552 RepID=A0AAW0TR33_SCYPA